MVCSAAAKAGERGRHVARYVFNTNEGKGGKIPENQWGRQKTDSKVQRANAGVGLVMHRRPSQQFNRQRGGVDLKMHNTYVL